MVADIKTLKLATDKITAVVIQWLFLRMTPAIGSPALSPSLGYPLQDTATTTSTADATNASVTTAGHACLCDPSAESALACPLAPVARLRGDSLRGCHPGCGNIGGTRLQSWDALRIWGTLHMVFECAFRRGRLCISDR